jgi:hypothetical protein
LLSASRISRSIAIFVDPALKLVTVHMAAAKLPSKDPARSPGATPMLLIRHSVRATGIAQIVAG